MSIQIHKLIPWMGAAGTIVLATGVISAQAATTTSSSSGGAQLRTNALGVPAVAPAMDSGRSGPVAGIPAATGASIATRPAGSARGVAVADPSTVTPRAGTTAAASRVASTSTGYNFFDSGYILRLRASAIQVEADIPHPLMVGLNTSAVNLEKDIGGPNGVCEERAAGEYPGEIAQEGILENSGPPDAGNKGGGIINPTESKDYQPNLSPGENLNARKPQLHDVTDGHSIADVPHNGNGPRWEAQCDGDAGGRAVADFDIPGVEASGSSVLTHLDKKTGEFTGTGRAFVAGLTTSAGTLDFVSSLMQVKALPGQEATVSYHIGGTGGTMASGADIPISDLTKQFNDSVKSNADALSAIGPLGLALLGPTVSESENGHRPIINAPFLEVTAGLEARKGTAGENDHVRLLNVDFEGQYAQ